LTSPKDLHNKEESRDSFQELSLKQPNDIKSVTLLFPFSSLRKKKKKVKLVFPTPPSHLKKKSQSLSSEDLQTNLCRLPCGNAFEK
jgi:hypothetical protein